MTRTTLIIMALFMAAATAITATTAFAGDNRKCGYQPAVEEEDRVPCLNAGRQAGEAASRDSQNMLKLKVRRPQGGDYQPIIVPPSIG